MHRIYLWFLVCLTLPLGLQAQQEPLFSQYRTNAFMVNPAVAGTGDAHQLRFAFRQQWVRFPGAPRTLSMTYHAPVDAKSGIGLMAFSDGVGPTVRSGLQLAYAFRAPVGLPGNMGQNYLSMGMGGKFMQYRFRAEQVYFQDRSDAAIYEAADGMTLGDVAFGAWFYNDRFFAGLSAPNLIQSGNPNLAGTITGGVINRLYRHYFGMMGYRFQYESMAIEPSVLVRKVEAAPYQVEGTVKFYLADNHLMLGMSYRTDWLITALVGVEVRNLHFYYASDLMLPQAYRGTIFGATHELTLGLDLGATPEASDMYYRE
ncbi:MAG: type IX secretion system membrane protein PorP/SprF [Bacteroidetes bacterium]|nr:MAG: type IX secretion system membrane protein PorP/SprF [Bacteroidota bacterium]